MKTHEETNSRRHNYLPQQVGDKNTKEKQRENKGKPRWVWNKPLYCKRKPSFREENNGMGNFKPRITKKSPLLYNEQGPGREKQMEGRLVFPVASIPPELDGLASLDCHILKSKKEWEIVVYHVYILLKTITTLSHTKQHLLHQYTNVLHCSLQVLQAGVVWVNCSQPCFDQAPWGGIKRSGIGRELGEWYDSFQVCCYFYTLTLESVFCQ